MNDSEARAKRRDGAGDKTGAFPSTSEESGTDATEAVPGEVKPVEVDPLSELHFDLDNPRLYQGSEPKPHDEDDVITWLMESADLEELLNSIATNGFLPFDDMVVIKRAEGGYRVLEGNRRLAAVRLLADPDLAKRLKYTVPKMEPARADTLKKIWVKEVPNEATAQAYIGFKHVNGPQKWTALAKARFVAKWLDRGISLGQLARTVGDTNRVIHRIVFGYRVLEQAVEAGFRIDNTETGRLAFSHLYTALTRPGYLEYLGLGDEEEMDPSRKNPVPKKQATALLRVMDWLFGNKADGHASLISSQNPDVKDLGNVLRNAQARNTLETTGDFKEAKAILQPKAERFVAALIDANRQAESALGLIGEFDGSDDSLVITSAQLHKTSGVIARTVKQAVDDASGKGKQP